MIALVRTQSRYRRSVCMTLVLIVMGATHADAQRSCDGALELAARAYDEGRLADVISLLTVCTDLPREQQWQAYRLLALAYLFDDRREEASAAVHNMLELHPEFEPSPGSDPAEFVALVDEYTVFARTSVHIRTGLSTTGRRLDNERSIVSSSQVAIDRRFVVGNDLCVGVTFNASRRLGFTIEGGLATRAYALDQSIDEGTRTEYSERLNYIVLPVTALYRIPIGAIDLNVAAGYIAQFLVSASSDYQGYRTGLDEQPFSSFGVRTTLDRRQSSGHGIIASVAAGHSLGRGTVAVEARYEYGLSDVVRADRRYDDDAATYRYLYVDPDFRLRTFTLSLAYVYPLSFSAVR